MFRFKKKKKECDELQLEQLELEGQVTEEIEEEITSPRKVSWPKVKTITCFVTAFALLVGSTIAYLTDYVELRTEGTAGVVQVSIDDSDFNLLNAEGIDILNPGDIRNVSFSIKNEGNKSSDTKTIITLTSSVPMTEYSEGAIMSLRSIDNPSAMSIGTGDPSDKLYYQDVYASEFEIYNAADVVYVEGYGYYPKEGVKPLDVRAQNAAGTKTVYTIENTTLSGKGDLEEREIEYERLPDTDTYELRYVNNQDNYFYSYYINMSNIDANLGYGYYTRIRNIEDSTKTVVLPESASFYVDDAYQTHNIEYFDTNDLYYVDIDTIIVSSTLKGFVYYDELEGRYIIVRPDELEAKLGIKVEFYDSFDDKFAIHRIAQNEYDNLSDAEKAAYIVCSDDKSFDLVLLFDPNAGNEFQNANVCIQIDVYAKQHRNSNDEDWVKTDSKINAIIRDGIFTVDYDALHRVILTGLKDDVDWSTVSEVSIPYGVEVVPYAFFYNCTNITKVNLPDTITEIGAYAFSSCTGLEEINIPENVERIGDYAFEGCVNLKSITIPKSMTSNGEGVFEGSGIESVVFEEGVTSVGNSLFRNATELESVVLPSTLKTIESQAFNGCTSLTTIDIPDGVETVNYCFAHTGLTSIVLPNSVTSLGSYTFYQCESLKTVVLSNQITSLGYSLFEGCTNLETVTIDGYAANYIGGKITSINTMVFANTKISNITIGSSVSYVFNNAFKNCQNLTTITIEDGPRFDTYAFNITSGKVATVVYTNNTNAINFNWSKNNRTVTINPLS